MSERLQPSKPEFAACTIIAKNYLPMARVLYESWNAFHPDCPLYVLLLDSPWGFFDPDAEPFQSVLVPELDIPNLNSFLFKYALLEASTAVKPYFLNYLFRRYSMDKLLYLDPDILILHSLDELKHSLDDASVLLTPHLLSPLPTDGHRQTEQDILKSGTYNLGFLGLRNIPASQQFLRWWCDKLYHYCIVAIEDGLFVDQKWMDLVPGMFDGVRILRDPGYNVAYWNLHERSVSVADSISVNGKPLYFFHFSGFDPDKPEIVSKYQDRFQMTNIGDTRKIYDKYRLLLTEKGWNQTSGWKYEHDFFRDGAEIPQWARRYYWSLKTDVMQLADPFSGEIRVQVFPFGATGYSEESSLVRKIKGGMWSTLIVELPEGNGRGPLRVDPADQPCFVELGDILVHSCPEGELLWSSSAGSRMGSLVASGTAVLLSGEHGSYLLSFGDDPQLMLMTPDLPGALKLTISLRVSFTPNLVPEVAASLVEAGQASAAQQVTAAQCERDAMANELGHVKTELIQAKTELGEIATARNAAELALKRTQELLDDAEDGLRREQSTREAMQQSRSWKVTEPVRRLMAALRSGPRRTG